MLFEKKQQVSNKSRMCLLNISYKMGKKNILDLFLILDDNVFIGKIFSLLKFEPNQYDKYDDINLGYF